MFGSGAALRVESGLANLVTSRHFGFGSTQSLQELGISLNDTGRLEFNEQEFREAYDVNPQEVENFFTTPDTGIADKFDALAEQLAGVSNSTLIGRSNALQTTIEVNAQRILDMNAALARERETLLEQFFRLEEVISQLQSSQTAIASIQPINLLSNN